ncbi:glycosyltransferase [Sphingobacterium spiritivorum]
MGGAEKLLAETLPILADKGIEVELLLLNGQDTFLKQWLIERGVIIHERRRKYYNPFYIVTIARQFVHYDLIHVHLFPAQYFAALAKILARNKNTAMVFTEHSTSNRRLKNKKLHLIERWIYAQYNSIICITPEVRLVLKQSFLLLDSKLPVIRNGINLVAIKSAVKANRDNFGYNVHDKLLIMVAAFREEKDQDTVVAALATLPDMYKLIFVGDGQRRQIVERQAEDKGVSERISFLGIRQDVYSLLKMADIAILSSHWEGFGLAAAEAMAAGIPVIASNVPGLAQVVKGGGILFEKGNAQDLKDKIIYLENTERATEVGDQGREKSKQYDVEKMVQQTIDLYHRLLS